MSASRVLFFTAVLIVVAAASWVYVSRHARNAVGEHLTVYYTKMDGQTEVPWTVSLRPQQAGESSDEHRANAALYAAVRAVAGPPSTVEAIRFPSGTMVRAVRVTGSNADVDLSPQVQSSSGGSFGESGEFKALVWTLTALPEIDSVSVRIAGARTAVLPGGHLELDKPLRRSDW
ncbi:MAG: hypothetical protein NVS1B14_06430 [Vulcanimicrobiaceae bacterium]